MAEFSSVITDQIDEAKKQIDSLQKQIDEWNGKIKVKEDLAETEDRAITSAEQGHITRWTNRVNDARALQDKHRTEIKELLALNVPKQDPTPVQAASTQPVNNQQLNMKLKCIEKAMETIKTFSSGMESALFVRAIKNYAHLAEDQDTTKYFLACIFTKLSPEYQVAYRNYTTDNTIDTVQKFITYINKQYESKKSIFQLLEEFDHFTKGAHEKSNRDYAGRLNEVFSERKTVVKAKFAEIQKAKSKSENMTADDVFNFWEGMIFLRSLKSDRDVYNYTINQIDECLQSLDIAQVADSYKERSQSDDPIFVSSSPAINYVRGNNGNKDENSTKKAMKKKENNDKRKERMKNQPCFFFQVDKCTHKKCPRKHVKVDRAELGEKFEKWLNPTDSEALKTVNHLNYEPQPPMMFEYKTQPSVFRPSP